jgi:TnsA endonuclease N terminal/TnsA endonuclease C terminal
MPVRKIPRSYCHVTGLVSSDKSSELIAYESRPERYFIKHASFNPNVESCEEQPVKIQYTMKNGKFSHYTPDFLVHFKSSLLPSKSWKPLLIEIKPRRNLLKDWSLLKPKFLAAREYAHRRGWEFTIISEQELVTPYLNNIIFLTRYRYYHIDESDQRLVLDALKTNFQSTPEALFNSITSDKHELMRLLPVLWKLVANFEIHVDLEIPLTMNSTIEKRSIFREENYECIYSLCAGRIGNARWRAIRYYP